MLIFDMDNEIMHSTVMMIEYVDTITKNFKLIWTRKTGGIWAYITCEIKTCLLRQLLASAYVGTSCCNMGSASRPVLTGYTPGIFSGVSHSVVCVVIAGMSVENRRISGYGRYRTLELMWYRKYYEYECWKFRSSGYCTYRNLEIRGKSRNTVVSWVS